MKTVRRFLLMMTAAVLLSGESFAARADPAPKQTISESSEKSADRQKDGVRNDKEQARPKQADENQDQPADVTRTTSKPRPRASHSKPIPTHQSRPAKRPGTNSPRTDAPASAAPLQQMGPNGAANVPNKVVTHHPSALPSAVSLNGQQFNNSRDPGAHLAVSGGPPASPRGTAAINGTKVKHK